MSSLRFLIQQLKPYVVRSALTPGQDLAPDRLELVPGPLETLDADRVYLLSARDSALLSQVEAAPGGVILYGDADQDGPVPQLPQGCSGVFFSCPTAVVHNVLAAAAAQTAQWEREFQQLRFQDSSLHQLVSLTARLADSAALLLDPTGRLIACAGLERSPYLNGQAALGVIPMETMRRIFPRPSTRRGRYAVPNTDVLLYGQRLLHGEELCGTLLVAGRSTRTSPDLHALCACAAGYLDQQLFSTCPGQEDAGSRDLRRCWENIMEGRLTSSAEILETLSQLPAPMRTFVRVGIITFQGESGVPYQYLLTRLREIFPGCNMTVYQKNILVLFSQDERVFRLELDLSRLTRLLDRYGGFMAISNGTRRLESLRSVYHLTQRTVVLGRCLRKDKSQRVFFHEDYSMYCIIDLCVKRYLEGEGNHDMLYLMHPAVIHLDRYDREHNTNLRDVLFYYLINDRNLVKTAAATYMHRNTVINKVNKILDLLKLDLEDGNLRQRLIISCQMIRYYELVMQHKFRP